jgi:hypothetical protein
MYQIGYDCIKVLLMCSAMAHMAPTYKNSAVCLIQNLKTRHGYNVTCNPCKVELNTLSVL